MRSSFVNWTKELANTVSSIGIVKGDVEKKSTSNGKPYTRCSLSVWKSSKEPPNRSEPQSGLAGLNESIFVTSINVTSQSSRSRTNQGTVQVCMKLLSLQSRMLDTERIPLAHY